MMHPTQFKRIRMYKRYSTDNNTDIFSPKAWNLNGQTINEKRLSPHVLIKKPKTS